MISNHYPLFFATKYNWIMVAIVLLMGPLIRHFFNERHQGKESPWWTWALVAICVIIIAWLMSLGPRFSGTSSAPPPTQVAAAQAIEIVTNRCSMCHAADPVWTGIVEAPKGVRLDGAEMHRAPRAADFAAGGALRRHAAGKRDRDDARRAASSCAPGSPRWSAGGMS